MAGPRIAPSLAGYIPPGPGSGPQVVPRRGILDELENLSYGIGQGQVAQLEGLKALFTQPAQTITGLYRAATNPRATIAAMAADTMQKARGGPIGVGQLVGEMLSPRSLLGVNAATQALRKPGLLEIDVYHGSPHEFDAFDSSKIGTGEGAQAYGHGLYFAESPDVAKNYAHNLTARRADRVRIDGNPVSTDTMLGRAIEDVGLLGRDAALQKLDDNIRFNDKYAPDIASLYRSVRKEIEQIDPQSVTVNRGNLYTVDLPDDAVETMLDWDAPLADQPFMAQSAIYNGLTDAGYSKAFVNDLLNRKSGMELYRTLYKGLEQGDENALNLARQLVPEDKGLTMSAPALASEALRRMGIRGIKYLDAGSRDAKKGTRNFVVFPGEEKRLRILKRE